MTARIRSELPAGAGLGSSAALAIGVLRALAAATGRWLGPDEELALGRRLGSICHGNPSGLDPAAAAQPGSGCLRFVRGEPPTIAALRAARPLPLVIALGPPRRTGAAVGGLRARWEADRARHERLFDEVAAVVEAGARAAEAGDLPALGRAFDENQALLGALGVSAPEVEALVAAARGAGALGAKLTGGGAGGAALPPPARPGRGGAAVRAGGGDATRARRGSAGGGEGGGAGARAGARLRPGPRWPRARRRLHALLARLLRAVPLGRPARAAGRAGAASALVPGEHLRHVELGARHGRAARAARRAPAAHRDAARGGAERALAEDAHARRARLPALARAHHLEELLPRARPGDQARRAEPVEALPPSRHRARDRVARAPPGQERAVGRAPPGHAALRARAAPPRVRAPAPPER